MKRYIILAGMLAVTACSGGHKKRDVLVNIVDKNGKPVNEKQVNSGAAPQVVIHGDTPELTENMQNGAIKSGDLYYMPMGKDAGGCHYYSSFSPGKVTLSALYYRRADGTFTNNKAEAVCN